jgi:undecaprenyl-phosphate 4-deoxy-4-formamido-L-arabinose transferase
MNEANVEGQFDSKGDTITNVESTSPLPFSVSVVVPVYNSEATLVELTARIDAVLTPLVPFFEIILVNDGSRDESWTVITGLAGQDPNIRGLNLMHNYGQHNALLAGIQRAQYEIIVTLDDDLQHPPEEIPKLLSKLSEGYDVVYGRPAERSHSAWRNISSKILKTVLKVVLGAEMGSHSSAFRSFRAILRSGFYNFTDARLSIDVLLSWSAARVTHIPVEHHARRVGKSGYKFSKLILLAFNMLTGYSTLPLRLASGLGLLTSLLGLLMLFYVVIRRLLQTTPVPGFAWIASEIALFAGMQLFAIGVIGEYVARLHFRTMGKPPYVIREEVGSKVLTMGKPPHVIQEEVMSDVLSK